MDVTNNKNQTKVNQGQANSELNANELKQKIESIDRSLHSHTQPHQETHSNLATQRTEDVLDISDVGMDFSDANIDDFLDTDIGIDLDDMFDDDVSIEGMIIADAEDLVDDIKKKDVSKTKVDVNNDSMAVNNQPMIADTVMDDDVFDDTFDSDFDDVFSDDVFNDEVMSTDSPKPSQSLEPSTAQVKSKTESTKTTNFHQDVMVGGDDVFADGDDVFSDDLLDDDFFDDDVLFDDAIDASDKTRAVKDTSQHHSSDHDESDSSEVSQNNEDDDIEDDDIFDADMDLSDSIDFDDALDFSEEVAAPVQQGLETTETKQITKPKAKSTLDSNEPKHRMVDESNNDDGFRDKFLFDESDFGLPAELFDDIEENGLAEQPQDKSENATVVPNTEESQIENIDIEWEDDVFDILDDDNLIDDGVVQALEETEQKTGTKTKNQHNIVDDVGQASIVQTNDTNDLIENVESESQKENSDFDIPDVDVDDLSFDDDLILDDEIFDDAIDVEIGSDLNTDTVANIDSHTDPNSDMDDDIIIDNDDFDIDFSDDDNLIDEDEMSEPAITAGKPEVTEKVEVTDNSQVIETEQNETDVDTLDKDLDWLDDVDDISIDDLDFPDSDESAVDIDLDDDISGMIIEDTIVEEIVTKTVSVDESSIDKNTLDESDLESPVIIDEPHNLSQSNLDASQTQKLTQLDALNGTSEDEDGWQEETVEQERSIADQIQEYIERNKQAAFGNQVEKVKTNVVEESTSISTPIVTDANNVVTTRLPETNSAPVSEAETVTESETVTKSETVTHIEAVTDTDADMETSANIQVTDTHSAVSDMLQGLEQLEQRSADSEILNPLDMPTSAVVKDVFVKEKRDGDEDEEAVIEESIEKLSNDSVSNIPEEDYIRTSQTAEGDVVVEPYDSEVASITAVDTNVVDDMIISDEIIVSEQIIDNKDDNQQNNEQVIEADLEEANTPDNTSTSMASKSMPAGLESQVILQTAQQDDDLDVSSVLLESSIADSLEVFEEAEELSANVNPNQLIEEVIESQDSLQQPEEQSLLSEQEQLAMLDDLSDLDEFFEDDVECLVADDPDSDALENLTTHHQALETKQATSSEALVVNPTETDDRFKTTASKSLKEFATSKTNSVNEAATSAVMTNGQAMTGQMTGTETAVARLLEYAPEKYVAVSSHATVALIESPSVTVIPGSVVYAEGLIQWQEKWIPIINLDALVEMSKHEGAPTQSLPVKHSSIKYALILAYQQKDFEPLEYAAIALEKTPLTVVVSNNQVAQLPEDTPLWQSVALSCFTYIDTATPIISTNKLFADMS